MLCSELIGIFKHQRYIYKMRIIFKTKLSVFLRKSDVTQNMQDGISKMCYI